LAQVKVSLLDIFVAKEAFTALVNADLPTKTSYWVEKIMNRMNRELAVIERLRNRLIVKHGTLDTEKQLYSVPPEKLQAFVDDFEGFLKSVDIDMEFPLLKIEDFPPSFKPTHLKALTPWRAFSSDELEAERAAAETKTAAETALEQAEQVETSKPAAV